MEELDPTFKKSWKLLPMLIFLIAVVVIFFFSISKLVKNSTQTETRAAGAEVIETTGIIYKMPKCLNSFLCFYFNVKLQLSKHLQIVFIIFFLAHYFVYCF